MINVQAAIETVKEEIGSIVMACDEAYAMPLVTAVRSMVEANRSGKRLNISVLTFEFSSATTRKIEQSLPDRSVSFCWLPIDPAAFQGFSTRPHISVMTYARLMLPSALPETVTKVLYIDPDVLVLDDLTELWALDLEDAVLGAVVDIFSDASAMRLGLRNLETPPERGNESHGGSEYFNAGVLLINLPRWRRERISENAFAYLLKHPETALSDQDALNVACARKWKRLDSRWNFQSHLNTRIATMDPEHRPGIAHFVTSSKPWVPSVRSWNAAFYDKFRSHTLFARSSLEICQDFIETKWAGVKNVAKRSALLGRVENGILRRIRLK